MLFTPVFTGGTGRSGTTIVVNLLARHDEFQTSMPREIKYLTERKGLIDFNFNRPIADEYPLKNKRDAIFGRLLPILGKSNFKIFSDRLHGSWWMEMGKNGKPRGLVQGIDLQTFETALEIFRVNYKVDLKRASRDFYFSLSSAQISSDEIRYFADSTPSNISNAQYLVRLFPNALFINMLRDGRDVAYSVSKEDWGPKTPEAALLWWEKRVEKGFRSLKEVSKGQQIDIRLEDLVVNEREGTFNRLLSFLNLEETPKLREYFNSKLVSEKIHAGEWRKQVSHPEKFDEIYNRILARLAKQDINIAKYY